MSLSFIRKHNYFSPEYYSPDYFCLAEELLAYRSDLIKELIGNKLRMVKWGFDIDDKEWFHDIPVLLYVNNDVFTINNWKLDETAFDKNIIMGTEFIDWCGLYDPITKKIKNKIYINDPFNFKVVWKEFNIKHTEDRIIQKVTPLVYDETNNMGLSLYNPNTHYNTDKVLERFEHIYPHLNSIEEEIFKAHKKQPCQALVGIALQFKTWNLLICNALDKNSIELVDKNELLSE